VVICLERGADLHMAQLMPLPLTVSCFSKIQIAFTFLVPADPGSPGQRAAKRVCVCVCVCVCYCYSRPTFHGVRTYKRGTVNRGTVKRGQLIAGQLIARTQIVRTFNGVSLNRGRIVAYNMQKCKRVVYCSSRAMFFLYVR